MNSTYVEKRDNGYWVGSTRVSLDSIVYAFLNGQSAESTAQSFPVLTLEQVYGAITCYLAHREEIDRYLAAQREDYATQRQAARAADPMFHLKIAAARERLKRQQATKLPAALIFLPGFAPHFSPGFSIAAESVAALLDLPDANKRADCPRRESRP